MTTHRPAPEWSIAAWLNTDSDLSLQHLRGQVMAVYAFQMLCRGCVEQAIPQALRVQTVFRDQGVRVIGIHTVFENHAAMDRPALEVFIREHGINFPVGVDQPSQQGGVPVTMRRYQMQGTPTLLLIDRAGHLRRRYFGHLDDLRLGAELMVLLNETA